MYLKKDAAKNRVREAENARKNRAEIVRALSVGQVSRRDLFRWGIFTTGGLLALKNGLSPFAPSAYGASIPTGTPRTPLFGTIPFTQPLPRLNVQTPHRLTESVIGGEKVCAFPSQLGETWQAKRLSWHTDFTADPTEYRNPLTNRGPCEGRPPGEWFAHQRWNEYTPEVGFLMSLGRAKSGTRFAPGLPNQEPNTVWTFGSGGLGTRGVLPPPLIKMRYGEPAAVRIYNSLPKNRAENNGFGRNEASTHNHNGHNGFASDGACNAYHFPGTFYDYHWSTTLARAATVNTYATDPRASGPDDGSGLVNVPGDFRELQGSLWFHDHRFFFTAENVYKGHVGMLNYYSGKDRGHEKHDDGINLRLPSGTKLPWGNIDFDVNLMISDFATDQQGQLFFDIFDTDGFLGDNLLVNFAHAPYFDVLPRKYRFRLLNACMSRFIRLVLVNASGTIVPITVIANDGNFLVNPVSVGRLDPQGTGERFDVIVDFSQFRIGEKLWLLNIMEHDDGRGPKETVGIKKALNRQADDPGVGPVLKFVVSNSVKSADVPGETYYAASHTDDSKIPLVLTEQIPEVTPKRVREIEFKRLNTIDQDECFPECGEKEAFPWGIRIDGESQHFLNANRASLVVPRPNEVEHWILKNGGGGWDHPVHLHFEEAITLRRKGVALSPTERLARKDVWRLGEGGEVRIQVQFSEYAGAYVTHCHNTVHEDFAMLMRYQILAEDDGTGNPLIAVSPTPHPSEDGVDYVDPEILPEGDPRRRSRTT
jgi:FtsP/CotA-like multicopper oxidase with cupredoxin domain